MPPAVPRKESHRDASQVAREIGIGRGPERRLELLLVQAFDAGEIVDAAAADQADPRRHAMTPCRRPAELSDGRQDTRGRPRVALPVPRPRKRVAPCGCGRTSRSPPAPERAAPPTAPGSIPSGSRPPPPCVPPGGPSPSVPACRPTGRSTARRGAACGSSPPKRATPSGSPPCRPAKAIRALAMSIKGVRTGVPAARTSRAGPRRASGRSGGRGSSGRARRPRRGFVT